MYNVGLGGGAGGVVTTIGGATLLPNTGGKSVLTAVAYVAIVGGVTAIVLQIALAIYKRTA